MAREGPVGHRRELAERALRSRRLLDNRHDEQRWSRSFTKAEPTRRGFCSRFARTPTSNWNKSRGTAEIRKARTGRRHPLRAAASLTRLPRSCRIDQRSVTKHRGGRRRLKGNRRSADVPHQVALQPTCPTTLTVHTSRDRGRRADITSRCGGRQDADEIFATNGKHRSAHRTRTERGRVQARTGTSQERRHCAGYVRRARRGSCERTEHTDQSRRTRQGLSVEEPAAPRARPRGVATRNEFLCIVSHDLARH